MPLGREGGACVSLSFILYMGASSKSWIHSKRETSECWA